MKSQAAEVVRRTHTRVYTICALLLLASAVNYMDRQTLAVVAKRITTELKMDETQYGSVEAAFGFSFAFGGLLWGYIVDRWSVRWVYPIGLLGWSVMGFLTGFVSQYEELLACRAFLGFFESAHWPCGLKATHLLLTRQSRAMGNSVLQSGTSIGAILTPLVMLLILKQESLGWRFGFQCIAVVGSLWVFLWLAVVRASDFVDRSTPCPSTPDHEKSGGSSKAEAQAENWWLDIMTRRFLLVAFMVIGINTMWQLLRAWLPKILQEHYHYNEDSTLIFNSIWYAATDAGCFLSGAASLYFVSHGWTIKWSRMASFGVCMLLCLSLAVVPFLSGGPLLLIILVLAGCGALGLFPIYYSFAQDVSLRHPGKATAIASTLGWIASSISQYQFGRFVDATKRYDIGLLAVGLLPVVPWLVFALFWQDDPQKNPLTSPSRENES